MRIFSISSAVLLVLFASSICASTTKRDYSLASSLTATSNTFVPSAYEYRADLEFELNLKYNYFEGITNKLNLDFTKDLTGERKSAVQNGYLAALGKIYQYKRFQISGDGRITLPFSEEDRKTNSFITKITLTPTFSYAIDDYWTLSYKPYYMLAFHKYQTAVDGTSNSRHVLYNIFSVNCSPVEKLSLSLVYFHVLRWSYQGNRKEDQFKLMQEIGYQVTKDLGVSVGHSNGGSLYKADGVEKNIGFYNEDESRVYAAVSWSY